MILLQHSFTLICFTYKWIRNVFVKSKYLCYCLAENCIVSKCSAGAILGDPGALHSVTYIHRPWVNSLGFPRSHDLLMRRSDWWSQYFPEKKIYLYYKMKQGTSSFYFWFDNCPMKWLVIKQHWLKFQYGFAHDRQNWYYNKRQIWHFSERFSVGHLISFTEGAGCFPFNKDGRRKKHGISRISLGLEWNARWRTLFSVGCDSVTLNNEGTMWIPGGTRL